MRLNQILNRRRGFAVVRSSALLFGLAVFFAPTTAFAGEGIYASVGAGAEFENSASIQAAAPLGGDVKLESSFSGDVAIGYRFESGWRIELEASRSQADITAGPLVDPGGSIGATGVTLGVYKEFGGGGVRPYLGTAVGLYNTTLKASYTSPVNPARVDDSDASLALKLGVGAVVSLSPSVDLDVGYRFFRLSGYHGTGTTTAATLFPVTADFESHSARAGLRVHF